MSWDEYFNEGKQIVIATSSRKGEPNASIVLSLGFVDNQLLIADANMITTIRNLKENDKVCIVGGHFKIRGTAKLFTSGEYFDICEKRLANNRVKTAILISVNSVFDLEKASQIK